MRLVGIPSDLRDDGDLATRSLFRACQGRVFPVAGIEQGRIELHVGDIVGEKDFMHSIYVEAELLETVDPSST